MSFWCAQRDSASYACGKVYRPSSARSADSDRLIAKGITGAFCGHSTPLQVRIPLREKKDNHHGDGYLFWSE